MDIVIPQYLTNAIFAGTGYENPQNYVMTGLKMMVKDVHLIVFKVLLLGSVKGALLQDLIFAPPLQGMVS